jgi:carboxymethylenebutenolidase
VLGFGAGGTLALASAARGFDAVAVNEAKIPKDVAVQLEGAAPLVASYGAKDRLLSASASRLERALKEWAQQEWAQQEWAQQESAQQEKAIDYDLKTYPAAGRGFLNGPDEGPSGRRWLRAGLGFLTGAGPEPAAADDAWNRMAEFFYRHLQVEPPTNS